MRARARKLDEGILIIRFEMPFNIWCLSCNQHIARGVRFNAEKKQAGNYYSTTIWSFRMKCHLCGGWMELQTDPKKSEYVVVEGARRKVEERTAEELELRAPLNAEEAALMRTNPFYQLEHQIKDQRVAKGMVPKLGAIHTANERAWKDNWESSRLLRRRFREEKRIARQAERRCDVLRSKLAVDLKLMPERPEDVMMARNVGREKGAHVETIAEATARIKTDSIFGPKDARSNFTVSRRKLLSFFEDDETVGSGDGNVTDSLKL